MISGYFLIEKTTWRWKGVCITWSETFFYSIIFLVATLLKVGHISFGEALDSFLPIWGGEYWFMTYYIGLMLLAPLISRAVFSLNAIQYGWVLLVLFVMNFQYLYGKEFGGFSSLMWFSFLFLSGGYIKRFVCPEWIRRYKGTLFICIWILLTLMALGINVLRGGQASLVSTAYHGPVFFLSLSLFIYFALTPLEGIWVDMICKIAPYTLAVYLIHANRFWQGRLWKTVIPDAFHVPVILHCLGSCLLIFALCVAIDIVRERFFKVLKIEKMVARFSKKLPQL